MQESSCVSGIIQATQIDRSAAADDAINGIGGRDDFWAAPEKTLSNALAVIDQAISLIDQYQNRGGSGVQSR